MLNPSPQLAMASHIWTHPSSWIGKNGSAAFVDFWNWESSLRSVNWMGFKIYACRAYNKHDMYVCIYIYTNIYVIMIGIHFLHNVSGIISRGSHPGAESTSFDRRPRLRLRLRLPLPEDTWRETEHCDNVSYSVEIHNSYLCIWLYMDVLIS